MVQHQSREFRQRLLPKLAVNVKAGQADPESYAMVLDRSLSEAGKPQVYGENLICDTLHLELHVGTIEDEKHVDQRRAAAGLMRLEIYVALAAKFSPNLCSPTK